MSNKRICLIIPSLQAGGMERIMSEIASYLSSREDVRVTLILYGITRDIFYKVPDNVEIRIPPFSFNNKQRSISSVRTLFFLRKTVRKIKPDSILSFGEYWNNFVLIALLGLRYPVYVSDRNQPGKSLGKIHNTLRQILYRNAKGIILQTEKAREIFLSANKHRNIAVIGNPVRNIKGTGQKYKRVNRVLMIGRFINTKHQDLLIEMFADTGSPDWELMLVGYDHLKQSHLERLQNLASGLGIENQVKFMGKIENVDTLYLESSIFAFTSSSEGFPNVIGEAMSAGLPVIAWDCIAGPSEMVTDGYNGYLIPLFDKEKFKSGLKKLMEDKTLRDKLGEKARNSIQKFSGEKICEAFFCFITKTGV